MFQYKHKPATPQSIIIKIGLTLYFLVPTKATIKITQLITKVRTSFVGEPKFSTFINTKAADANKPTTAGRKPLKIASTIGCF